MANLRDYYNKFMTAFQPNKPAGIAGRSLLGPFNPTPYRGIAAALADAYKKGKNYFEESPAAPAVAAREVVQTGPGMAKSAITTTAKTIIPSIIESANSKQRVERMNKAWEGGAGSAAKELGKQALTQQMGMVEAATLATGGATRGGMSAITAARPVFTKIAGRAALGAAEAGVLGVSKGIAERLSPEETLKTAGEYAKWGALGEVAMPYVTAVGKGLLSKIGVGKTGIVEGLKGAWLEDMKGQYINDLMDAKIPAKEIKQGQPTMWWTEKDVSPKKFLKTTLGLDLSDRPEVLKGRVNVALDPDSKALLSWSTDNPELAKTVRGMKQGFALGTEPIKPSEAGQPKMPQSIQDIKTDIDAGVDVGLKKFTQLKEWETKNLPQATQPPITEAINKPQMEAITPGAETTPPPAVGAENVVQGKPTFEESKQVILDRIPSFRKLWTEQKAGYSLERGEIIAKATKAAEETGGLAGFKAQKAALKGELSKIDLPELKIPDEHIDSLMDGIQANQGLDDFQKVNAKDYLIKALEGGVLTNKQSNLLKTAIGDDIVEQLVGEQTTLQKVAEAGYQVANIPKAIMSSFDVSMGGRQGIFMAARFPKEWASAVGSQFKYLTSEKGYQALQKSIVEHPNYGLAKQGDLALTDIGKGLGKAEEAFMSNYAEKIPGIRQSDRAFTGGLNKLRFDTFNNLIELAKNQGWKPESDPNLVKGIARLINNGTGRGELKIGKASFEGAAKILNTTFFSPRLMMSRLKFAGIPAEVGKDYMMKLFKPNEYVGLHPFVRKEMLKTWIGFTGATLSVLGLASLAGAKVEKNPLNADFGKIKVGNTRIDITGGLGQYVRLVSQLVMGKQISSTTGKVTKVGEGYKPINRLDIIERFFQNKEAPLASFATALLTGTNAVGQKLQLLPSKSKTGMINQGEIASRFMPMISQDLIDLYNDKGVKGLPAGIASIFGLGVQTYGTEGMSPEKMVDYVTTNAPYSGTALPQVDKMIQDQSYEAMMQIGTELNRNPQFIQLSAKDKEAAIRGMLKDVRKEVKQSVLSNQAQDILPQIQQELKGMSSSEAMDYLNRLKSEGLLSDTIINQLTK